MNIRYSDYTVEQLREEMGKVKEEMMKAEQLGEINKVAILERKMQMLGSYLLNPDEIEPGQIYELSGDPGYTFQVNFMEGVMAWGNRINLIGEKEVKETALPISLLGETKRV